jgi:hypothetical protein
MRIRLLLPFLALGLAAVASAKTYSIELFQPAMIGNTGLKPGTYSVEVADQKVIVRNGKFHEEVPARMEDGKMKYTRTSVVLLNSGGQMHIQEIHIGGTKMKLVFTE